jgi:hypothetical protein
VSLMILTISSLDPLLMNAFNTVNLAAACLLTSTEYARQLGVPESQWIYPLGGAGTKDSDYCTCALLDNLRLISNFHVYINCPSDLHSLGTTEFLLESIYLPLAGRGASIVRSEGREH